MTTSIVLIGIIHHGGGWHSCSKFSVKKPKEQVEISFARRIANLFITFICIDSIRALLNHNSPRYKQSDLVHVAPKFVFLTECQHEDFRKIIYNSANNG